MLAKILSLAVMRPGVRSPSAPPMILNNYPHFVKYEWGFFVGSFVKNPDARVALFHTVNTFLKITFLFSVILLFFRSPSR